MVVQRLLPLQPGITPPYNVLTPADVTNYPIENAMIKASSTAEYKSSLTEENLRNHLSDGAGANAPTTTATATATAAAAAIDILSSNSKTAQNIVDCLNISENPKCDRGIEICDMIVSATDHNKPLMTTEYFTADLIDSDEEENNRIRQRLNEDPGIQSLMEISLPSPIPIAHSSDECKPI